MANISANICTPLVGKLLSPLQFHPFREYEIPPEVLDDPGRWYAQQQAKDNGRCSRQST